ncbi:MAG TPA: universal stress protein, partial [Gaiellaceae bacterium]|nr:universal stress protein [Gaiellaceae bacterium]
MSAVQPPDRPTGDASLFDRVLVGVDETPESLVGAAQARVLCAPGGHLAVVAVAETYHAAHAGMAARLARDVVESDTAAALERARELADPDESRITTGRLVDLLREERRRAGASLIVVGARPRRRLGAAAFRGHDVELLEDATCAVLVARPGWGPSRPSRIVVGVDGSEAARAAESTARALADRLGAEIMPVVPLGAHPDPELLRAEREDGVLATGGVV